MQAEQECARICDVVRRHPHIWYKSSSRCDKAKYEWASIAEELGEEKSEVQAKWQAYRDAFLNDMTLLPKLPGRNVKEYLKPEYKKNPFFKFCLFLADPPKKSGLTRDEWIERRQPIETPEQKEFICARIADVVRKHPFIWYKFYPERKHGRSVRWHHEWQKVAEEVGLTDIEVKKRWTYCRGRFVNDMKRLPELQPGHDITEYLKPEYKTSRFFKYFLFLRDPSKSGLTPAQITGEEEMNYEADCQSGVPQENDEINIKKGNDWELRNMQTLNDIEDDDCMYIGEEDKSEFAREEEDEEVEEAEEFLPSSVQVKNANKTQSELTDNPNTNYTNNRNVIDLKNIKRENEPTLYGNTIVIDDDDDDDDDNDDHDNNEGEVKRRKTMRLSSNKENELRIEELQSFFLPQHQPRLENYSNVNNMNGIGSIMDLNASQSSKTNNVETSTDNRLDCDDYENSLYLRSLLPYFRQFNSIERMQVRIEFGEVIKKVLLNKRSKPN